MTITPRPAARYGWVPDLPDNRDHLMLRAPLKAIPKAVDLSRLGYLGTPYNQGNLGSCTYNAIGKLYRHALGIQKKPLYDLSRLFGYYGEREIEGTIDSDAGAMIRDGMKVLAKLGAPDESLWPYDIAKFRERPPAEAYAAGVQHQCLVYTRVSGTVQSVIDSLARGFPVVTGFTVYESFESQAVATTGTVPNPRTGEAVLGGHAVLIVGYDRLVGRTSCRFKWLNSWGDGWGDKGYFYTKSSFLGKTNASDFWTIEVTE